MASRKLRGGHRRTVSCTEADMAGYEAAISQINNKIDSEATGAHTQSVFSINATETDSIGKSSSTMLIDLINACSANAQETTVVVEQLNPLLSYQDPLFQFGKTKKVPVIEVNRSLPLAQENNEYFTKPIQKQNDGDLFMIPEINCYQPQQPIKKSKSSRATTKTTEADFTPPQQKQQYQRTNNLMCKLSQSPSESTLFNKQVFSRIKAQKKQTAKQRQNYLTQKIRARLHLINLGTR